MIYSLTGADDIWRDLARFHLDMAWAAGEAITGLSALPALTGISRHGNGAQPVITFPGFSGSELSLAPLNLYLNQIGFRAESWSLGINQGPTGDDFYRLMSKALRQHMDRLTEQTGQKVSLVGQSVGGLYAREVARDHPDLVDRVITLASPVYAKSHSIKSMNNLVAAALNLFDGTGGRRRKRQNPKRDHHEAPPVPLVAIYTRCDGILDWQATRIPTHELTTTAGLPRENIEIFASHGGMTVNPLALLAVSDRLTADPQNWVPFNPESYLGLAGPALGAFLFPPTEGAVRDIADPALGSDGTSAEQETCFKMNGHAAKPDMFTALKNLWSIAAPTDSAKT